MKSYKQVIINLTHKCNLSCDYCYYSSVMKSDPSFINLKYLENIIKWISNSKFEDFIIILHGGEPLTLNTNYYKKLMDYEKEYFVDKKYINMIQTNGVLLRKDFVDFIVDSNSKGENIIIGVSLDGAREIHDHHRKYLNGHGSFDRIMKNIELLQEQNVKFGVLSVLSNNTAKYLNSYYSFFKSIKGMNSLNLLPSLHSDKPMISAGSLKKILIETFHAWIYDESATFNIQLFSAIINNMMGIDRYGFGLCSLTESCFKSGNFISIEPNGNITLCDSLPNKIIGNVSNDNIDSMFSLKGLRRKFIKEENDSKSDCYFCNWNEICHGGCPSHRLNRRILCSCYKYLFTDIYKYIHNNMSFSNNSVTNFRMLKNPVLKKMLESNRYS